MSEYLNLKRKILLDHLEKYQGTPSLTLARILVRDYPEFFVTLDNARTAIRLYRGQKGDDCRNKVKIKKYFTHEV